MRKLIRPLILLAGVAGIVLLASMTLSARVAVEQPLTAAITETTNTARSDNTERLLENRGLMGDHAANHGRIAPPAGTEVYETVEKAKSGGQVMSHTTSWGEALEGDTLWIEVTDYPSRQYQVSFWVLSGKSRGCAVFGRTMYSHNERRLQSEFWRNDRALKITGAADFPPDPYPAAVPAKALPRVLDSLHAGAQGTLSQQITPYGYVDMKVSVEKSGRVTVPAGSFSACKVSSQPDVAKLLPSWPRMLLRVVSSFIPATTYYFQSVPPYRFLKKDQQGSPFVGGPEATTELVRYYTAGSPAQASDRADWSGRQLASLKPEAR